MLLLVLAVVIFSTGFYFGVYALETIGALFVTFESFCDVMHAECVVFSASNCCSLFGYRLHWIVDLLLF